MFSNSSTMATSIATFLYLSPAIFIMVILLFIFANEIILPATNVKIKLYDPRMREESFPLQKLLSLPRDTAPALLIVAICMGTRLGRPTIDLDKVQSLIGLNKYGLVTNILDISGWIHCFLCRNVTQLNFIKEL